MHELGRIIKLMPIILGVIFLSSCTKQHAPTDIYEKKIAGTSVIVGILTYDNRVKCAGLLIAPDLVLTGAHCFYSKPKNGKLLKPEQIRFVYSKSHNLFRQGIELIVSPKYNYERATKLLSQKDNWAVLKLDGNVTRSGRSTTFSLFSQQSQSAIILGFSKDSNHAIDMEKNCTYQDSFIPSGLIVSECDKTFITGSPILQKTYDGKWSVVAIHLASDGKRRFGIKLEKILIQLKSAGLL